MKVLWIYGPEDDLEKKKEAMNNEEGMDEAGDAGEDSANGIH